MEYLMTYGWAILIIAVVLGALFSLGVFNGANFAPKAPPGACQVFRPNGPGSTSFINLEGVCSGELPEYVAQFIGSPGSVSISNPLLPSGQAPRTATLWFVYPGTDGTIFTWTTALDVCGPFNLGGFNSGGLAGAFIHMCSNDFASLLTFNVNAWNFVAVTFYNVSGTYYVNVSINGGPPAQQNRGTTGLLRGGSPPQFNIGGWDDYWPTTNGDMSNVQVYNTSLSPTDIKALYMEGIGGAPIDLQNLVGWWPLNGNAQDYSGNGNNGQATNVIYTSSWTNGYTTP